MTLQFLEHMPVGSGYYRHCCSALLHMNDTLCMVDAPTCHMCTFYIHTPYVQGAQSDAEIERLRKLVESLTSDLTKV